MNVQRSILSLFVLLFLLAAGCSDTVTGPTVPGFESEKSFALLNGTVVSPDGSPVYNAAIHILLSYSPTTRRDVVDARRPMPSTTIRFSNPTNQNVSVHIFRLGTREHIATLIDSTLAAGTYSVNVNLSSVADGFYVYRLQTGNTVTERLMAFQRLDVIETITTIPLTRSDGSGKFSLPISVFGLRERFPRTSEDQKEVIGTSAVDSVAIVLSQPGRSPSITWMHLTDTRNTDATFILP